MKRIYFTVTNDLTYDQRMSRICTSLAENGYAITLVGRKLPVSLPLDGNLPYKQKRIRCWFNNGKLFYAEYNIRLFFFLLTQKMDAICSIDLDTILPGLYISKWKRIERIYDAHELFTELPEVIRRPKILKAWTKIEKKAVPQFKWAYTVSESIANEFNRRYGVNFETIRNVPLLKTLDNVQISENFILYQGAVNEGRCFEYLIPAMQWINTKLIICGDGNFMEQLKKLISDYKIQHKVELKGMLAPDQLWSISQKATIGIALAEKEGLNQYLALPNKFFDYIHATLPQVTMDYPEYQKVNNEFEVAVLINTLEPERIAEIINNLLADTVLHSKLNENCRLARKKINWQQEEKKLLAMYQSVFNP